MPIHVSAATVVDQLGRKVCVPDHPGRIVCLAPSITEIMFALDLSDRLAGATQFSDYPPQANRLAKVGSYVRLDVEKIVALKPDLCIAVKDGNPLTAIRKLEALGIPVYAVDPRNLEAVMDTLQELGRLLSVSDRSDAIVAGMRHRIERVRQTVAGATHRPTVFFQIGIAPIVSVGTDTFIHELIDMAGGVNLAAGDTPYPRFSKEAVIASRPEVLIITSMARKAVFEQVKREWREWESIPAVKNDRIYLVDSNVLDRATPRLADGLEMLARLIHPDRFGPNRFALDQSEAGERDDKGVLP
ncbi:cobalamin-binding protein [Desulfosarcina widdelii]|uniref:Cobalamin-binding protein n=2 Tax=Desulfosarcina widdelii TaxID=947919 RepID=A0A5K7Z1P0_9BACT|nr:cobalamin-binding protein [Desulfosarcina widdelii]